MAKSPATDEAPLPAPGQVEADPSPMRHLLERRAAQVLNKESFELPTDDSFRTKYPKLWELLQPQQFRQEDDKYDRAAAPYSVEMTAGGWRITIRDPNLEFSVSAFSPTHEGLLKALEKNVCDPSTWAYYKSRGKKLRKVSK